MLRPILVLSANIEKHTRGSFNRVIIVASSPISSRILCLGKANTINAKQKLRQEQQGPSNVCRVILFAPVPILFPCTPLHTRVSTNRVLIAVSGRTSKLTLRMGKPITIDAKEEMQQEQQ